jgi:hypothetical protein
MASRDLEGLVGDLAQKVVYAKDSFTSSERNEEFTKVNFILKLLEELGWDSFYDVSYEDSPQDTEGRLDFVLRCHTPIGIEAKALDVTPPKDLGHKQIQKGLEQSQKREASYFIWTNGDSWQFFSLALPNAPMYSLTLSEARGDRERVEQIANQFYFIQKEAFSARPELFDEAIRENWRTEALPAAVDELLSERMQELAQLVRRDLPNELDIKDEQILEYFKALQPPSAPTARPRKGRRPDQEPLSFPEDWQELLDSFEPKYSKPRRRFQQALYRKVGQFIIDQSEPWSKRTTFMYVGIAREDESERRRLGPVMALFNEWNFIQESGDKRWQRVDKSVPFLKKLLEERAEP